MYRLTKALKKNLVILILIIFTVPTFYRMLRPGIYSMQDFHFFRLAEYDRCIKDFQVPCRWSANSAFGYGVPLFNFYGQLPYLLGELFHSVGFSLVNSLKLLFILSVIGSGVAMFFLARKIWQNNYSAFVSAIVYMYAPYRAIDIWVRGALPEALSFIFYPLILLVSEKLIDFKKDKYLISLGLLIALLILNHNLSFFLFFPFYLLWIFYRLIIKNKLHLIKLFAGAILLAFLLSSFYLFPVLAESKYISLENTIKDYFDFKGHFVGLRQLLLSTDWGYGASVFGPEDGLNLSIGFVQWVIPMITLFAIIIKKKHREYKEFFLFVTLGLTAVFLINNKSIFIWKLFSPMAYIQFPWRYLAIVVFYFSLASGAIVGLFAKKYLPALIVFISIFLTLNYFKEDIWYKYSDQDLLNGQLWIDQSAASRGDYWPNFGTKVPDSPVVIDNPFVTKLEYSSHKARFAIRLDEKSKISFPIPYFPGWEGNYPIYPENNGLITSLLPAGRYEVLLKFKDTPIRKIGNAISLVSALFIAYYFLKTSYAKS